MAARREDLLQALRDAHAFYLHQLPASWVPDHLNRRNLYPQMQPAQIGYAPAEWTTTLDHLRGRGHRDDALLEAGLALRARNGHLIDFFRDRLMVPLTTGERELVGFIGRCSTNAGDQVPKYLNSPQTAIFSKHDLLYGLGDDAERIRRGAMPVIVEGPLDRLAIAQGARNLAAVGLAPCGTALTSQQVQSLLAVVGTGRAIAVALDPDPAGRAATLGAWNLFTEAGATKLLHVTLPEGKDPAELIRIGRGVWLRAALAHSRPLAFAVADQRIADAQPDPINIAQRVEIAHHVVRHDLAYVPAPRVGPYVAHLADRLSLDTQTMTAIVIDAVQGSGTCRLEAHQSHPMIR